MNEQSFAEVMPQEVCGILTNKLLKEVSSRGQIFQAMSASVDSSEVKDVFHPRMSQKFRVFIGLACLLFQWWILKGCEANDNVII